ncbi:hypothetical protein BA896_021850 [Janthinobacterium lividum]|uniref:Major capsid protein n=1 Tax=Janthinobacterium lividum TaxID=29581 RepID=A0A1E8PKK0_9BURK|nr:hypothetical protein BA896_021850 [Janthinobacterium lividum]
MPMTNRGVRIIDPILTGFSQGYRNSAYIGEALFPRVPVGQTGGQILEFGREAFQLVNMRRQPGGATKRIQFGYLGKPYTLLQDSLEVPVPREHQRDASKVLSIDLGQRASRMGMNKILLQLEVDQAALATNAANYAGTNKVALAGAAKWSASTGNPLTDVDTGREAIRGIIGIYPNTLVLSALAFNACKNNPNVIARFQYNGSVNIDASQITTQMLAGLFNVDKVVVGKAIVTNDALVNADIWGNNAVLAYVPQGETFMEEPSYGYTYTLDGNPLVEQPYWDNNAKAEIYGVTMERAPVLSGISSGYLIQTPA